MAKTGKRDVKKMGDDPLRYWASKTPPPIPKTKIYVETATIDLPKSAKTENVFLGNIKNAVNKLRAKGAKLFALECNIDNPVLRAYQEETDDAFQQRVEEAKAKRKFILAARVEKKRREEKEKNRKPMPIEGLKMLLRALKRCGTFNEIPQVDRVGNVHYNCPSCLLETKNGKLVHKPDCRIKQLKREIERWED